MLVLQCDSLSDFPSLFLQPLHLFILCSLFLFRTLLFVFLSFSFQTQSCNYLFLFSHEFKFPIHVPQVGGCYLFYLLVPLDVYVLHEPPNVPFRFRAMLH